ncbi:hypothetical protein BV22DRAFT_1043515 [Leucogyrophana mollusca]|uniref:Uncharacterized protein n=1 Tax=Leucogyrophana mollusca TaxID=85980 RepID=A0ACB8BYK2_9AGAM|nr:hypothetical protein BV22DRAFT_1043515 [Leucogyrophana mollusca]
MTAYVALPPDPRSIRSATLRRSAGPSRYRKSWKYTSVTWVWGAYVREGGASPIPMDEYLLSFDPAQKMYTIALQPSSARHKCWPITVPAMLPSTAKAKSLPWCLLLLRNADHNVVELGCGFVLSEHILFASIFIDPQDRASCNICSAFYSKVDPGSGSKAGAAVSH